MAPRHHTATVSPAAVEASVNDGDAPSSLLASGTDIAQSPSERSASTGRLSPKAAIGTGVVMSSKKAARKPAAISTDESAAIAAARDCGSKRSTTSKSTSAARKVKWGE